MQIFFASINELIQEESLIVTYLSVLSSDEKIRYEATKLPKNKLQFLLGRVLLRTHLSERLNCSAQEIKFHSNENGRLELASPFHDLKFSLSHSGDFVLLAVSDFQIGVDLEFMKERNFLKIANFFFEAQEIILLKENPTKENFYTLWTLKEAYIKCLGERLFSPQTRLAFSLNITKKIIQTDHAANYQFISMQLEENYIVSLALEMQNPLPEPDLQIFQVSKLSPVLFTQPYKQSKILFSTK